MNKNTQTSDWRDSIEFCEPPYEIKVDGKIVDDLNILFDFISTILSSQEQRHQREVKKINDIVVGAFLEIAGTVWGIDAPDRKWTDRQMTYFNVKVAEIRDKCLDQISQSIKEIK